MQFKIIRIVGSAITDRENNMSGGNERLMINISQTWNNV